MQNVNATKERILSIIEQKGPSYPVQIARMINVSPLFTSVFLSELKEDNKIRTSHMKLGSSPLFFIDGQESQLENFVEHLNQREKEAFYLIKKNQVLEDSKQTPVMRVALRAIKDFATPFKITSDSAEKIFWKYHLLEDIDFDNRVKKILDPLAEIPASVKEVKQEAVLSKPVEQIEPVKPVSILEVPQKIEEKPILEISKPITIVKPLGILQNVEENIPEMKKPKKVISSEFADKIKDYLSSKNIEILSSLLKKKKEFVAKIRADTLFGKQEYYLIAKDKKKINENDISLALQKAQTEKMIALILSPGEIDKKATTHIKEWRNLVKFDKINL